MSMTKLKPKTQKRILMLTRALSQILFFILFPSAFSSAFNGIKYIFTQLHLNAHIELTSFLIVLIALCLFTIVFGRFFCGFACAFGALGDALNGLYIKICKKAKKKPIRFNKKLVRILFYLKYLILLAIVIMCFFGIYGGLQGYSPWDVFSTIRSGAFKFDGYAAGIIILVMLLILMTIHERFFCKFICPMGAVFSLLPILPIFTLKRNRQNCIKGCRACEMKCPAEIKLADKSEYGNCGNCFMCQKCISTCPKQNISTQIEKIRGNEIWFTIIRCVILALILVWAGV